MTEAPSPGDGAGGRPDQRGPRLYRFHWREKRGGVRVIRWRQERLRPAEARTLAATLAAAAVGGAVRVAIIGDDDATLRCVTTNANGIATWGAGRALPPAAPSDWTAAATRRNRRVRTFSTMRELLWRAEGDGLIELGQAASFAHAFSLALDGSGPFAAGLDE